MTFTFTRQLGRWALLACLAPLALASLGGCSAMTAQNPSSNLKPVNAIAEGGDDRVMLKGADVVAYFTQNRYVQGSPQFKSVHEAVTFRFASAEHKALFDAAPQKYLPQYGGYCAWAVSQGYTADIDPNAWKVVNGKLYLNYDKEVQKKWEANQAANISAAEVKWPALLKE